MAFQCTISIPPDLPNLESAPPPTFWDGLTSLILIVATSKFYQNRNSNNFQINHYLNCNVTRILKAHSRLQSKSGRLVWVSLEWQCCFSIAGVVVSYLSMRLPIIHLFKNGIDIQAKLRFNPHSLSVSVSVSELLEYRRARFIMHQRTFYHAHISSYIGLIKL